MITFSCEYNKETDTVDVLCHIDNSSFPHKKLVLWLGDDSGYEDVASYENNTIYFHDPSPDEPYVKDSPTANLNPNLNLKMIPDNQESN